MAKLLDPTIHDAVEADHQPREAAYDDGSTRMLYWNGTNVRSVPVAEWPGAAQAEIAEGEKRAAQRAQLRQDALALVGRQANQMTLPELRALFLLYLERDGLIDSDGKLTDVRDRM